MTADRARLVQELRGLANKFGLAYGDLETIEQAAAAIEGAGVEVERLRAERDAYKDADESMQQAHYKACVRARKAEARAERLAEALRLIAAEQSATSATDAADRFQSIAKAALAASSADGEG